MPDQEFYDALDKFVEDLVVLLLLGYAVWYFWMIWNATFRG